MKKVTKEEFDYFLSKINFSKSFFDSKAIDIMNRLDTIFQEKKELIKKEMNVPIVSGFKSKDLKKFINLLKAGNNKYSAALNKLKRFGLETKKMNRWK